MVIAAIGLVMLPVHLATYRERGILRRFDVSRYPRWALPAAWIVVAMVITAVAVAVLLVTGQLVYGLPAPDNLLAVAAGTLLGAFSFISIGIAVGLVMPSARSAQGLGMLLFFPFFLLGGAGPPPDAMGDPMSTIANVVPLTHVVRSIQEPWLDLGTPTGHPLASPRSATVRPNIVRRGPSRSRRRAGEVDPGWYPTTASREHSARPPSPSPRSAARPRCHAG